MSLKKILLALGSAFVLGLGLLGVFLYRTALPSSADHQLLTLVSSDRVAFSVALNLRLLKSARSTAEGKDRLDKAEKYLLKAGNIPDWQRELFLETFSSIASGHMKTDEDVAPFRVFAVQGSADQALKALEAQKVLEATSGEDYVFIDPETCAREEPLRLVRGDRLLAFVPAALAAEVSARLTQEPSLEMETLLIGRADVRVQPYLETLAPGMVQMIAEQLNLAQQARSLALSLRADKNGGVWAELDVAGDGTKQLQALWEEKTNAEPSLKAVVEKAVTLQPGEGSLRFTFDVNALQQQAEELGQSMALTQKPLKEEDLKALTEEEVLDPQEVFSYEEALTPEAFFSLSSEECRLSGLPLASNGKLSIAFESLSARLNQPGVDFVRLLARSCLPPPYLPLLSQRPMLEVSIRSPEPDRHFCGPLAGEKNGLSSKQSLSKAWEDHSAVRSHVSFAFKPGVDTQKLAAIEGSVTQNVPTRVKTLKMDFRPPYARARLALPEGTLSVEGTGSGEQGLTFAVNGEGTYPTILAVRALNQDGKYLKTQTWSSDSGSLFDLPILSWFTSEGLTVRTQGRPVQLEVVVVDASTPLTHPFTFKPPFPASPPPENEDEEDAPEDAAGEGPSPVALTQDFYEKTYLAPGALAQTQEWVASYLEREEEVINSRIPVASPIQIFLWKEGMFQGNLGIMRLRDLMQEFKRMGTKLELEIQEVDFADGTRLRPADLEAYEETEWGKRRVWGSGMGPVTWRTAISFDSANVYHNEITGTFFDDYIPDRMEDVPVARIKGQFSLSLPKTVEVSPDAPLSLHAPIEMGGIRFRVLSIEPEGISILGEGEGQENTGISTVFSAEGRPVKATLKERKDFSDGFRLDFETEEPARAWKVSRPQGGFKTYTYPFELVTREPKRSSRQAKN
ncbi:hypothetical protein SAMN05444354_105213 [Stigmatella aurantiaca]|uniref:Uncharacterized protein n=1 Tax=Stigmatella aurantiaca TaxID=41 RepID=A0A1H7P9X2_STIAU|nr:hypothetical protein [Stigmatella aurantiaca]SEL32228.1 hypothetical protein SAMN05444354_105213 [Stigmatella aurantiaca]